MDKIWIVFLFLGVLLIVNNTAKRLLIKILAVKNAEDNLGNTVSAEDKEDPVVFWNEEGKRREPENAEYILPESDFFENEVTEFPENFEDEFSSLSDEEKEIILEEAGLFLKGGDA